VSVLTHASAGGVAPFYFPEIPFHAEGRYPKSLIGKNFCAYLLELRNSSASFKGIRKALIDTLLDGYESARYGTGVSAGAASRRGRSCALVWRLRWGFPSFYVFFFFFGLRVFHCLFCLCPGVWEAGISEVPGCFEWAGEHVSVATWVHSRGVWWWLLGPQQPGVKV